MSGVTNAASRPSLPPVAVTMGEPAGIGGELILKAWARRAADRLPGFFAVDDPDRLRAIASDLGLDVPIEAVGSGDEARTVFASALPVLPLDEPLAPAVIPGAANAAHAEWVLESIERAVQCVAEGQAAAVVTNPIQKQSLYAAGFSYPGHTEYLAALTGSSGAPVMMLVSPRLRVVPVTIHLPLAEVAAQLSSAAIIHAGRTVRAALTADFGIASPRLAVAALNPHAGEGGTLGRQEIEVIAPAIETLAGEGIRASGPYPADTLFHADARARFDAVLCMYHDQALIPLKTLDFDSGVNCTLGLPIVRTSPDHGTALDIAGRGVASPTSLVSAIRLAAECAHRRQAARR